jgi:hypothetical protein
MFDLSSRRSVLSRALSRAARRLATSQVQQATLLAFTFATGLFGFGGHTAAAQSSQPSCSWPLQVTGSGPSNVFYPDTDATYWVMSVNTTETKQVVINGTDPKARFFAYVSYNGNGDTVNSLLDENITPNAGSTSTFQPDAETGPHNYSITVDGNTSGAGNHLYWGNQAKAFFIYRVYVADKGLPRTGGVPLPSLTLTSTNGVSTQLVPCSSSATAVSAQAALSAMPPSVQANASSPTAEAASKVTTCSSIAPQTVVNFVKNTSDNGYFGDPASTYYDAGNLCLQKSKVLVIRGKGAVYPNTYQGGTIFQPAIPGAIQIRYWSMCNNDEIKPYPVVACAADHATALDEQGYYTYVMSPSESLSASTTPPSWVPAGATWLPWGVPNIPNILLFRETLPMPGYEVTGDYLPKGVYCDKDTLLASGWQGCFADAGVSEP